MILETPEYRNILKEKTKQRNIKLNEGNEPKPRGRPRKTEKTEKEKKANGRPRKYLLIPDIKTDETK